MSTLSWVVFLVLILFLLILDLGVLNRADSGKMSVRKALFLSAFWIGISLLFNLWIYYSQGLESALNFFTGYLVEKALSIDNLFVFLIIFSYFQVEERWRHKVLFWGILGALAMRALFIAGGIALVTQFEWLLYVFGVFLIVTAIKLAQGKSQEIDLENNVLIRLLKKVLPIDSEDKDGHFFTKKGGIIHATPLFLALASIEFTDVVFALDSIPAIFGITQDPYIIYTSNIFAILGLRSLYFALQGMMDLFHYLHYGLAAILFIIGTKMLLKDFVHLPIPIALGLIAIILTISIAASLYYPEKKKF